MSANESYAGGSTGATAFTAAQSTWAGNAAAGVARVAAGCFEGLWRGYKIRRTVAEMSGLDSHTLRDIGIDRSDIVRVARAAVDGRTPGRPRPRWHRW